MTTNGNDLNQQLAAKSLQHGIQAQAKNLPRAAADEERETYDLATRIRETAKAMRDLADYSNHVATDLERITAAYISNMQRLLGRFGK